MAEVPGKRAIVVFVLCVLSAHQAAGARQEPRVPDGVPHAVLPVTTHDLGTVKQGGRLTHVFVIRNDGTAPLEITRIELSLPGTKTQFQRAIPPGREGRITMDWDTSNLQGEFEAQAVISLNDPDQPKVSIGLTAVVKAAIEFVPFPQVFFSAYRDDTPERYVQILNNEERPLKIIRTESPSNHYTVSIDTVRPGFSYEVRVKVQPGVPFGRYANEPIYLHTDSPAQPRLQLLANLFVKPDFYAAPEELNFGTIRLEPLTRQPQLFQLLKNSIALTNREGPVEIKRIESDVAALQITQSPAGSSEKFRLDVALAPDKVQRGSLAGTIRIATTNPEMPLLIIPVRGEVK